jgi:hypothetical protein
MQLEHSGNDPHGLMQLDEPPSSDALHHTARGNRLTLHRRFASQDNLEPTSYQDGSLSFACHRRSVSLTDWVGANWGGAGLLDSLKHSWDQFNASYLQWGKYWEEQGVYGRARECMLVSMYCIAGGLC